MPTTWIGAAHRHEPRTVGGQPVLVKLSTIPKGTRNQSWFGPTDQSNHTVTADVQAVPGGAKLPDMGGIAQRYGLDLMGESQQLQIRTWAAQLRMARSQPYVWQSGRWYTLKFTVDGGDDRATLRGKVWPRDEPEPPQWTVTAEDPSPNTSGSPGLFGNATNGEILYDNVSVE